MGFEGGSADRRAREMAASGDESARDWAAGAEGERRVAEALAVLGGAWTVLHDRLLRPGLSEANLDHLVAGPAGVLMIDAKNWSGDVTEWEGGLYRHASGVEGIRKHQSLHEQVAKVHGMGARMAEILCAPVTPVICLAGVQAERFGEPKQIRGVWVVPVGQLALWLTSLAPLLSPEAVAKLSTRLMTEFPSTTTDPELLAAMGRATLATTTGRRAAVRLGTTRNAIGSQRVSRSGESAGPGRSAGRGVASVLGRIVVAGLVLCTVLILLKALPSLFTSAAAGMAQPRAGRQNEPTPPPAKATPKAGATPVSGPDCADATGAEIAKIVHRRVKHVAVFTGCAWGTRLDDAASVLVTIRMSAGHGIYETQLETSAKQRRAVYGTAYDASYDPATAVWIAAGEPIGTGASAVKARADTYVVVARSDLGVSDDRGRAMALAIARAANTPG